MAAAPDLGAAHYQLGLLYRRKRETAKADEQMRIYGELRRREGAELDRRRRELRQFVTVLKEAPPRSRAAGARRSFPSGVRT